LKSFFKRNDAMKISAFLFLLLLCNTGAGAQNIYGPADFIQVDGGSLKARFDNAVVQGRQGEGDTFWVAYETPARANRRIASVDGIDVSQTNTLERMGMFVLVRKSDGAIDKLRIVNLTQDLRVHDRKVYWLGEPSGEDNAVFLLNIARTSTSTQVKKDAIFWLGQEISRRAGIELERLASDDPEVEVQKQVVFALSLRNNDESIPSLMRIAKEHPNLAVRQQAIFWLGRKRDPRVLDFFDQILR
jgi:hypothetical protein